MMDSYVPGMFRLCSSHLLRNWRVWSLDQQMHHKMMVLHGIYGMELEDLASSVHSVSQTFHFWIGFNYWIYWHLLIWYFLMSHSRHSIWILELFWSDHDKLFQCIIRDHSDTGWDYGDVNWGARLLHVYRLCTEVCANRWESATVLSGCRLLHVSLLQWLN